jgi:hypothetical protein
MFAAGGLLSLTVGERFHCGDGVDKASRGDGATGGANVMISGAKVISKPNLGVS